jgi:lipopolysaccharide export LptBFGC system permease protein LptF
VKKLVAALLAGGLIGSVAQAAPRAESAMECGIAADMAVVAHSLAREDVHRTKADAIMGRIYDVAESDRGKELMRDIMDAAYNANSASGGATFPGAAAATASGQKFAEELFAACMKTGGNMDTILGHRS